MHWIHFAKMTISYQRKLIVTFLISATLCVKQCSSNEQVHHSVKLSTNDQITEFITGGLTQIIWDRVQIPQILHLVSERCSQSIIEVIDGIETGQTSAYQC